MKDRVEFSYGSENMDAWMMAGYAGGVCPIDKVAELILSSNRNPIHSVEMRYQDGRSITATVLAIFKDDRLYDADWEEMMSWPRREKIDQ